MTYSLNTLQNPRSGRPPPSARSGWSRFADELALLTGLLFLGFWFLSLLTYAPQDAAWSTSGNGDMLLNRAGRAGAWLADGIGHDFTVRVLAVPEPSGLWLLGLAAAGAAGRRRRRNRS